MRLGLKITEEQIAALRAQVETIDFDAANAYERRFRHDVMAHIHALGDAAPLARPIIHLGATSCFVTDNADLILIRAALRARPRQDRRRDRRAGRRSPRHGRNCPAWATPTSSPRNW